MRTRDLRGLDAVAIGSTVVVCVQEQLASTLLWIDADSGAVTQTPPRSGYLRTDLAADGEQVLLTEEAAEAVPDATLVRLDLAGNVVATSSWGRRGVERALGVDGRAGVVAITGDFRGRTVFDDGHDVQPVRGDAFVIFAAP